MCVIGNLDCYTSLCFHRGFHRTNGPSVTSNVIHIRRKAIQFETVWQGPDVTALSRLRPDSVNSLQVSHADVSSSSSTQLMAHNSNNRSNDKDNQEVIMYKCSPCTLSTYGNIRLCLCCFWFCFVFVHVWCCVGEERHWKQVEVIVSIWPHSQLSLVCGHTSQDGWPRPYVRRKGHYKDGPLEITLMFALNYFFGSTSN